MSYLGKTNEEYQQIIAASNRTAADYRRLAAEAMRKAVVLSNAPYQDGGVANTDADLRRLQALHDEVLDMTLMANLATDWIAKILTPLKNPTGPLRLHPAGHGFVITCDR